MSEIQRYDGDLKAFASNSTGTNRTIFDDTAQSDLLTDQINASFLKGWEIVTASEEPKLEDFNAVFYAHGQLLAYLHQAGVPEWNISQEYKLGGFASDGAGGLYVSKVTSNIGNALPADSDSNWSRVPTFEDVTQSATDTTVGRLLKVGDIDPIGRVDFRGALSGGGITLEPNRQYHITDSLSYSLPDTTGLSTGASVVITKSVSQSPTITTFGAELITTDLGSASSIALEIDEENVFVWSSTSWELVAGGKKSLLIDYEVPSNTSTIDFTGLDINTDKSYRFEMELLNPVASLSNLSLFPNDLTTSTEYYTQADNAFDTTQSSVRSNFNRCGGVEGSDTGVITGTVHLMGDGSFIGKFTGNLGTGVDTRMYNHNLSRDTATSSISNITKLTLTASVASSIGAGSIIRIYRGNE